jgi:ketosteroid isomerase-like protein
MDDVVAAERALQAAMRTSDVAALDRLLHDSLVAVAPDGSLVDKASDLESHRSGVFEIRSLEESSLDVVVSGDTAVTFVVLDVEGSIAGEDASGPMRYTRTWTRAGGEWRVLAAHITPGA